jgi:hypothetical protein
VNKFFYISVFVFGYALAKVIDGLWKHDKARKIRVAVAEPVLNLDSGDSAPSHTHTFDSDRGVYKCWWGDEIMLRCSHPRCMTTMPVKGRICSPSSS